MAKAERRSGRKRLAGVDPQDFSPALLRVQAQPPAPFARSLLYALLALFFLLIVWSAFGHLDVVASAEGKLIPQTYLKIVQPSEQGLISEILVNEGQQVKAGQVLMRMDTTLSEADGNELSAERISKQIAIRRIDAELSDQPFQRASEDVEEYYAQTHAQYQANRLALETALSQERSVLDKANSELGVAQEVQHKLRGTLPNYREQDEAYRDLAKEGYVSRVFAADKHRERIEKEQDLKAQEHTIQAARATIAQSGKRIEQITADYRQKLQAERADTADKLEKLEQELAKQQYRHAQLELKAPQDGTVKDLATHTIGTVFNPGTILMTLVPKDEAMRAEVWVSNEDVGFIHHGEPVKVKLASYQFQKYGMIDGNIAHLSADASENLFRRRLTLRLSAQHGRSHNNQQAQQQANAPSTKQPFPYRALIDLKAQFLEVDGVHHTLSPGMQVTAEIHLGTRTILEYLLSPVRGAFQEAGRER